MKRFFIFFVLLAFLPLTACKSSPQVVSADSVAVLEASYISLTSAYIAADSSGKLPDDVAKKAYNANQIVYPYIVSLRKAAEAGDSVPRLSFIAASVALTQLYAALSGSGIALPALNPIVTGAASTTPISSTSSGATGVTSVTSTAATSSK